jgi:hypothetical protein
MKKEGLETMNGIAVKRGNGSYQLAGVLFEVDPVVIKLLQVCALPNDHQPETDFHKAILAERQKALRGKRPSINESTREKWQQGHRVAKAVVNAISIFDLSRAINNLEEETVSSVAQLSLPGALRVKMPVLITPPSTEKSFPQIFLHPQKQIRLEV